MNEEQTQVEDNKDEKKENNLFLLIAFILFLLLLLILFWKGLFFSGVFGFSGLGSWLLFLWFLLSLDILFMKLAVILKFKLPSVLLPLSKTPKTGC